jgi:hypothetical protein
VKKKKEKKEKRKKKKRKEIVGRERVGGNLSWRKRRADGLYYPLSRMIFEES